MQTRQTKSLLISVLTSSLLFTSCASTYYSHEIKKRPDMDKVINNFENVHISQYPTHPNAELIVSLNKVSEKEVATELIATRHTDNSETRIGGWVTMALGGLTALVVGNDHYDDDGTFHEANPDAAKGVLIGSLFIGGAMALIPDSKEKSSEINYATAFDKIPVAEGTPYVIWADASPEHSILRETNNGTINIDLVGDLFLDYFENRDFINLNFQSVLDKSVFHQIPLQLKDWLVKTVKIKEERNAVAYYAASTSSEPAFMLRSGEVLKPIKKIRNWYKVEANKEIVFVQETEVTSFYALD